MRKEKGNLRTYFALTSQKLSAHRHNNFFQESLNYIIEKYLSGDGELAQLVRATVL